jgi:hypothetical protein
MVLVSVGAGRPTVTVVPPTAVTAIAVSNARELPAASMTTSALTPAASASAGPYTSAAPSSRARSRFPATASIPITFPRPSDTAVISAAMPTPPSPTTMTVSPSSGFPALITAPPPVSTAQPSTAATCGGTSSSTGTSERRSITA